MSTNVNNMPSNFTSLILCSREILLHFWCECKLVKPPWKSIWQFLRKLRSNLPQDPAILFLGIYPQDAQLYCKDTCSTMWIAALFLIARAWKQHRCLSMEEQINKMWYLYTMGYTHLLKAMTSWNLMALNETKKKIILNEVTQTQKNKCGMYSLISGYHLWSKG